MQWRLFEPFLRAFLTLLPLESIVPAVESSWLQLLQPANSPTNQCFRLNTGFCLKPFFDVNTSHYICELVSHYFTNCSPVARYELLAFSILFSLQQLPVCIFTHKKEKPEERCHQNEQLATKELFVFFPEAVLLIQLLLLVCFHLNSTVLFFFFFFSP